MRLAGLLLITWATLAFTGCQPEPIDVVDLNQVLNELAASLAELDANADEQREHELTALASRDEHAGDRQQFLDAFARNLTSIEMISQPIGVIMVDSGDLFGFGDLDTDNQRDEGETTFFRLQIDEDRDRLIASDGEGHFRDHAYDAGHLRHFTYQLVGTMLGRKQAYYTGRAAVMQPDFEGLEMSPKDYYPGAVARARSRKRR